MSKKISFPSIAAFPVFKELISEFRDAEVFMVGGAVRDALLGKKTTDLDFLIRNVPSEELEEFLATRGRVVLAGKTFGVWKFHEIGKPKHEQYDIALPRTEFSMHKQGVYQDFSVTTDHMLPLEKDLSRRDFTINAMAYDLANETLIDPHHGQRDLTERTIRTVGDPRERFQEDFSRMLRALRFGIQLGFALEHVTDAVLKKMIGSINNEIHGKRVVPYEVIAEEFMRSLIAHPRKTIEWWDAYGALEEIAPELIQMKSCPQPKNWHSEGDVWTHTLLALDALSSEEFKKEFGNEAVDIELILAVLFHDVGKPYTIKTPERDGVDRIRFDDHDQVGAEIGLRVLERLKTAAPPKIHAKPERIAWPIRHHMIAVHGEPEHMRTTTIEKYFFNEHKPSRTLLKLLFVDGQATISDAGESMADHYARVRARIAHIRQQTGSTGHRLVTALVSGSEVMEQLQISPGKKVGEVLEHLRQKQLSGEIRTKEEACAYLRAYGNTYHTKR